MIPVARNTIMIGDVRDCLRKVPDASIDCVITSPPYFLLRDYGVAAQIGLEDHVDLWVEELRQVMQGVARVLKTTGSAYLVLGDSYSRHPRFGAAAKSLLLGPARVAIALVADGWCLRNSIVWAKPNAMPTSTADRLNTTWEPIYFLTKSRHYFYDLDAIRVPHRSSPGRPSASLPVGPEHRPAWAGPLSGSQSGLERLKAAGVPGHPLGKNPGDVWTFATSSLRNDFHASFPTKLVDRAVLASCPERVCRRCGEPWQRQTEVDHLRPVDKLRSDSTKFRSNSDRLGRVLRPECKCKAGWQPGIVLDPFFGAGTVGLVAQSLRRDWIGIELNRQYAALARDRIDAAREQSSEARRAA